MTAPTIIRFLVAAGLLLSFAAGFLTHKSGLHAYLRPLAAAATRDLGGCRLGSAFSALDVNALANAQAAVRAASTLVETTPDGLACVKTPRGTFWMPANTDWTFVLAEQMLRIYGNGPYRVRPRDVVLDCGANIGAFTREALDAGAALVIAIEPVPANVESLRRTFRTEIEAGRVRIVSRGVWNREDTLKMHVFDNPLLNSFVMPERPEGLAKRQVDLPLTTIDAIVQELGLEEVHFIKMDVEGAERQAIEGARSTIARFKPRMSIATENLPDDYAVLPRMVAELDAAYESTGGDCRFTGRFTVRPGTLHFRTR